MDNNQKLEFVLQLERKAKRKKIIIAAIVLVWFGAILIYSQYKNFESVSS